MTSEQRHSVLVTVFTVLIVAVAILIGVLAYFKGYSDGVADMETCVATSGLVCPT